MKWIALAYSLPAKSPSTQRVSLWRRLRRLGAVAPVGGVYLLPAHPECVEAFQWLAQEICQGDGEAFACITEQFHGMSEQQLVEFFNSNRDKGYAEITAQLGALEATLGTATLQETLSCKEALHKLRHHYTEIVRIDFFHAPLRTQVEAQLTRLEQALSPEEQSVSNKPLRTTSDYIGKKWVTRPRPHVDRLACAWLIRRYIDPQATIRYANEPASNEVAFDMSTGEFGHHGNLCTFEMMLHTFQLAEPALQKLAEIVHEIDLRDGRTIHPETDGIDTILEGWLLTDTTDPELERQGIALFEGLYASFAARQ